MKPFLVNLKLTCGLALLNVNAWAQVKAATIVKSTPSYSQQTGVECSKLYESPPHPTYKDGGFDGMFRCITKNLHYPKDQTRSGRVYVNFLVTKAGDVSKVKVQKGLGEPFDAEALRVVRLLGKWVPTGKGQDPIYDLFTIPVVFTYSSGETKPRK